MMVAYTSSRVVQYIFGFLRCDRIRYSMSVDFLLDSKKSPFKYCEAAYIVYIETSRDIQKRSEEHKHM